MEQHVQEAASRNASQRGAKVYNSCICLPGYALVQDCKKKKGGRITCCAQVLRDFWVDLLSLHDVNKTYLNTASFWLSGKRGFFDQNSRKALKKWWCKWVWILLQDKFQATFLLLLLPCPTICNTSWLFVILEEIIGIWSFSVDITASGTWTITAFRGKYPARVNHKNPESCHR